MMDWLFDWVRDIAVYLVLITAVMNVIPNNSYRRYIRLFTGMILILLLVSPIAKLFGADELMDFNFDSAMYQQELASAQENAQYFENVQTEYLTSAYEEEVKENITQIVTDNGMYPVAVQLDMDTDVESEAFGTIRSVSIAASYEADVSDRIRVDKIEIGEQTETADSYEQVQIKKEIESFYNVSADNINISIQR